MKENQVPESGAEQLPIDEELKSILLQITNCRARLTAYMKLLKDRELFELLDENCRKVTDDLIDVIYGITLLIADCTSYSLIENRKLPQI